MLLLGEQNDLDIFIIQLNIFMHCLSSYMLWVQAESLLKKNLENANVSLQAIIEDSLFLRDQITITEVTFQTVL